MLKIFLSFLVCLLLASPAIAAEKTVEFSWLANPTDRLITVGAASDTGAGTVLIPSTGHHFKKGESVTIAGTDNYDSSYTLPAQTNGDTDHVEITTTFTAETFDGTERIYKPDGWINKGDWLADGSNGGRIAVAVYYGMSEVLRVWADPTGERQTVSVTADIPGRARVRARAVEYRGVKWEANHVYYVSDDFKDNISPFLDEPAIHYHCAQAGVSLATEPDWSTRSLTAAAASDTGSGTVLIPCTAHGFAEGDAVVFTSTDNYDNSSMSYTLPAQTNGDADHIEITATYVAETFDGTETVHPSLINEPKIVKTLTASASTSDTGSSVLIPCAAHGYAEGDNIMLEGTDNYNGAYTLGSQVNADADHVEIPYPDGGYVAETFDGTENFYTGNIQWQRTGNSGGIDSHDSEMVRLQVNGTGATDVKTLGSNIL